LQLGPCLGDDRRAILRFHPVKGLVRHAFCLGADIPSQLLTLLARHYLELFFGNTGVQQHVVLPDNPVLALLGRFDGGLVGRRCYFGGNLWVYYCRRFNRGKPRSGFGSRARSLTGGRFCRESNGSSGLVEPL
jgi:hypothetical protein